MTRRIPIIAAKAIADKYIQTQVIILTWDKVTRLTHVVTYGTTKEDCRQAVQGRLRIKEFLGLGL